LQFVEKKDEPYPAFRILEKKIRIPSPVSGSLDKKGGRRCHLLLNKDGIIFLPFLANEPGPGSTTLFIHVSRLLVVKYIREFFQKNIKFDFPVTLSVI
jgi:hypothetical protein